MNLGAGGAVTMSSSDEREVAAKWDANAAKWADDVRAGQDRFRDLFTFPRFLDFLPDLRGSNVIDLGCGEMSTPVMRLPALAKPRVLSPSPHPRSMTFEPRKSGRKSIPAALREPACA